MVEGTALAALPHMRSVLARIPPSFTSLAEAVAWSTSSGRVRNAESAAVSLPPQLVKSGSNFVWRKPQASSPPSLAHAMISCRHLPGTDLAASEQHWQSWLGPETLALVSLCIPLILRTVLPCAAGIAASPTSSCPSRCTLLPAPLSQPLTASADHPFRRERACSCWLALTGWIRSL